MTLALILKFLKDNWKVVALIVAVLSLVGYVSFLRWEVKHYKAKYQEVTLELTAAKHREKDLQDLNEGITKKYSDSLKTIFEVNEKNLDLISQGIKKDEELKSITLSYNSIRLFNKSKRDPATPLAKTEQGNAGKASATEAPSVAAYPVNLRVPLTEVFLIVAENDANHWKAVKQVEMWQSFWADYEAAVARAYSK